MTINHLPLFWRLWFRLKHPNSALKFFLFVLLAELQCNIRYQSIIALLQITLVQENTFWHQLVWSLWEVWIIKTSWWSCANIMGFIRSVSGWCSSALIRSDQLSAVCVLAPGGDQENQHPPKYTVTLALRKIYLFICLQYHSDRLLSVVNLLHWNMH